VKLSWNRILSGLLALGYVIGAYATTGGEGCFKVLMFVILPLACIWFGEAMGGFTGPSGSNWITAPSPGKVVCVLGWLLLALPVVLILVGCGERTDAEFRTLLDEAQNDLVAKTSAQEAAWGFGKATRWDLNQDNGLLVFTFPDKTVTCEAQIIGLLDKSRGTWLWSWGNLRVATNLTIASRLLAEVQTLFRSKHHPIGLYHATIVEFHKCRGAG
jgi:hypothetical protein